MSAIRDLMGRAARDLSRVNANALNADGRSQFETARRFLQQAEEALKIPNIVFAGTTRRQGGDHGGHLGSLRLHIRPSLATVERDATSNT